MVNKFFAATSMLVAVISLTAVAIGANTDSMTQTGKMGTQMLVTQSNASITPAEENLKLELRTLWNEHIVWTRMAIMSIAGGSADKDAVLTRLLKNYDDMADAMKPFYGNETADRYGDLIEEHLVIAASLVEAAKAGNNTAFADADKNWYKNADEIATFESSINPNFKLQDRKVMWNEHLNLTKAEAVAILTKDYNKSISTYDTIEEQAMMMADSITSAIVQQFPDRFA